MNTPIFEACINEKIALKYPLISISNPDLKYLPTLDSTITSLTLNEKNDSQVGKTLEFTQKMATKGRVVPSEIVDPAFIIMVDNDLLALEKQSPVAIDSSGIARYIIPRTAIAADQGAKTKISVFVQSLTSDAWDTLGSGAVGSRTISSTIKVRGVVSGLSSQVPLTINEQFSR